MSSRASSRSEGEISLTSDSDSKATKSLPSRNDIHVDRHTRPTYSQSHPSAHRSPPRRLHPSNSRSRSPYRTQRVEKRRRNDDYEQSHERPRHDTRSFDVKYEDDHPEDGHRRQKSYEDLDTGHQRRSYLRYEDDDNHRQSSKRRRTKSRSRSRSPYRHERAREHENRGHRHPDGRESQVDRSKESRIADKRFLTPSASKLGRVSGTAESIEDFSTPSRFQKLDANPGEQEKRPTDKYVSDESDRTEAHQLSRDAAVDRVINQADLKDGNALQQSLDEAALIDERRKRREAIKNKFRGQATPLLVQALQLGLEAASPMSSAVATPDTRNTASPPPASPQTVRETSGPQSPAELSFTKDVDLVNENAASPTDYEDEPSAADYDPTIDMQEERARHDKRMFKEDEASMAVADQRVLQHSEDPVLEASPSKNDADADAFDMFAENDNDDDMFADATIKATQQVLPEKKTAQALDVNMMDNWDDPEGYYNTILGELIANRYHVTQNLGRGMFSSVVRATDTTSNELVAIKIIRNNDTMRKAGMKEIDILKDIAANDPEDKKHVIRLHRSFEHKGHLCMVFENLSLNLREVLKKFGRDIGINLKAIRAYAQQLFLGLSLLKKCQYIHADLKPDNILVNEGRNVLKICDLGSASPISENVAAPYLVSRFYRAPEIILGIPYDTGIDVWSVGCTLFELYTGKILFTGRNNNAMLRSIMECRGRFPHKLLRKASFAYQYFDDLLNFQAIEDDRVTGRMTTKMIEIKAKPVRDIRSRLVPKGKKLDDAEKKDVELLLDLLDKCLDIRPEKRITPTEALRHPFILRTK